jgi:uncharacterized protein (TIGR03067 family)
MKRFAVAGLVVALGISGVLADDKTIAELEGTYKAVALTKDGKEAPDDVVSSITARIAGDEITFTVSDKNHPAKFKIDTKAKPAHIDLSPSDGTEKGKTFLGIYKLEKGELILAFTEKGDRPTEFKGEGDVRLIRLKPDPKK